MTAASRRFACPLVAGLALAAAMLAAAPGAACDLRLNSLNDISFPSRYDPFAASQIPQSSHFIVQNRDAQDCLFVVGVNQGATGGRRMAGTGASTLRYNILRPDNQTVTDAPSSALNGMLTGTYRGNSGTAPDMVIYATIPAGQIASAGSYSDQLTVNLYELVGGQPGKLYDTQTISVRAVVGSVIQSDLIVQGVHGALGGRVATLDFGELRSGQTLPFELQIDGNTAYQVTLASDNQGQLAGTDIGNRDSRVLYTVTLDGREANLSGPLTMPIAAPSDYGRSSNHHTFQVQIGDVSRALAGRYADNLLVTVSAN